MKRAVFVLGGLLVLGAAGLAVFVFGVQNVETPRYSTVLRDGIFEVRDYPSLVIAEVRRQGNREESLRRGFGPLARYIYAQERGGERIAMTAPVIQQRVGPIAMTAPVTQSRLDSGDWAVRFIMPARYRLDDLPAAASDVQLAQVPARRSAAIRFSGHTDDAVLAEKERECAPGCASKD